MVEELTEEMKTVAQSENLDPRKVKDNLEAVKQEQESFKVVNRIFHGQL